MRVALQKTSLIDYPGRVACVIFLPGCNLRCPYCHNAALVEPELHPEMQEDFIELEDAFVYLEKRKKVLEAVVISGGEPCIHGGLARLAERAAGLGLLVKLDTNGLFPERLPEIKVDFIALDLKTALSRYEELPGAGNGAEKRIRSTIDFLRKSGVGREYRTTLAPGLADKRDVEAIARELDSDEDYVIQRFRPDNALDPVFRGKKSPSEEEYAEILRAARKIHERTRLR